MSEHDYRDRSGHMRRCALKIMLTQENVIFSLREDVYKRQIHTCGTGLFARLPESFHVTRYHSLVINGSSLPDDYQVDAISEDGAVMGISHRRLPLYLSLIHI